MTFQNAFNTIYFKNEFGDPRMAPIVFALKHFFKVLMKRKLSLSYLKEHLKGQSNFFCSFWFSCFVFEIFQFV